MTELLKRYWMMLVAGALAAWAAYSLINPALHLERTYERQANADTAYYADKAQKQYSRDCVKFAAPARDQCRYEKAQSAREGQHDAQDLKAQLITSVWTRQMGFAAIIGMAVSIVGVILVWTTFRETRVANEIARENSAPYFNATVRVTLYDDPRPDQQPKSYQCALLEIANHGFTRADRLTARLELEIEGLLKRRELAVTEGSTVANLVPNQNNPHFLRFEGIGMTREQIAASNERRATVWLAIKYQPLGRSEITECREYAARLVLYEHPSGALQSEKSLDWVAY